MRALLECFDVSQNARHFTLGQGHLDLIEAVFKNCNQLALVLVVFTEQTVPR